MLFFLSPENKYHRILRRGIIIGVLSFLAVVIYDYMPMAPEALIPLLTAVGAMLDKYLRSIKE